MNLPVPRLDTYAESRVSLSARVDSVHVHPRYSVLVLHVVGEGPSLTGEPGYGDSRKARAGQDEKILLPISYAAAQHLALQVGELYDVMMLRRRS